MVGWSGGIVWASLIIQLVMLYASLGEFREMLTECHFRQEGTEGDLSRIGKIGWRAIRKMTQKCESVVQTHL